MKRIADRILIIPTLRLEKGRCVQSPVGEPGTEGLYPVDPARQATLWRLENTKMLHVIPEPDISCPLSLQHPVIARIVDTVEISIQVEAAVTSVAEARMLFEDTGVYRLVIAVASDRERELVADLIQHFGPRRIVPSLVVHESALLPDDSRLSLDAPLIILAKNLQESGAERIIVDARCVSDGPPIAALLSLAEQTEVSLTLNGSVRGYHDLKRVRPLRTLSIDSIILENTLYLNAFPCQKIWRLAEQQLIAQDRLIHP
jgi:phosphoribosylformimino-5-aminoimidazole carboxamide ribotide isomerase